MDLLSMGIGCVAGSVAASVPLLLALVMFRGPKATESRPAELLQEPDDDGPEEPEAIPEALFLVSKKGAILWASAFARGLFGRGIVGSPFADVLPDWGALEEHRSEKWLSSTGLELGVVWNLDARTGDGETFAVRVQRSPTSNGYWVVLRDKSADSRRLERITKANARLQTARDDAERASRAKTAYLARVAQAMRTPLNAMKGYGQMIGEELEDQESTDLLDDVRRLNEACERLEAILVNVLDWTEVEAGRMELTTVQFDISNALEDAVARAKPAIERGGNTLEVEAPEGIRVVGDARRTTQVVAQLLANAAAHTENGTITLHARRWDEKVAISVRDTGAGIAPDALENLFLDLSKRQGDESQTGIGLLLSHTLIGMMGGELSASSEVGKGSTFTMLLKGVDDTEYAPPMLLDD